MTSNAIKCDVLIIGAGLTGSYLAYLLRATNLNVKIIEARKRLGGRIYTSVAADNEPIEMGATWLGRKHQKLIALLSELKLDVFEQEIGQTAIYEAISTSPHYLANLPPNPEPSLRIKGGSHLLIKRLTAQIKPADIYLDEPVKSILEKESKIVTQSLNYIFESSIVVSTLPPNLLMNTVQIEPELPENLNSVANATHTWMGESIKIGLTYSKPFWKAKHLSGTIMSNVGPIPEMYDHSNFENSFYALKGFFAGNYFSVSKEERLKMIMKQLAKYYGDQASDFLKYDEMVWRNEPYTFSEYTSHVLPHQNNGHQIYQQSFLNGKLFVGGTETTSNFPGYMEGAVQSALEISRKIIDFLKEN